MKFNIGIFNKKIFEKELERILVNTRLLRTRLTPRVREPDLKGEQAELKEQSVHEDGRHDVATDKDWARLEKGPEDLR